MEPVPSTYTQVITLFTSEGEIYLKETTFCFRWEILIENEVALSIPGQKQNLGVFCVS